MRTKQSLALFVALGSLVGCGPIAFNDTITFADAKPQPKVEAEKPAAAPQRPATVSRAKLKGDRIEIDEMIQFEYDSAVIKPESHGILDDVVTVMQDNPRI